MLFVQESIVLHVLQEKASIASLTRSQQERECAMDVMSVSRKIMKNKGQKIYTSWLNLQTKRGHNLQS